MRPAGFADFTPLVLHGSLEGCLYAEPVGAGLAAAGWVESPAAVEDTLSHAQGGRP